MDDHYKKLAQSGAIIAACAIIGLALINALNISFPLTVTTRATTSELSVVGEAKLDIVPDVAKVNLGIQATGKTVEETQSTITTINNKIIDELGRLGIAKKDIQTSQFALYPSYDSEGKTITDYSGNVSISVTARDISKAEKAVTRALAVGANQVNNISYEVSDPALYREKVRKMAIDNAKEQAKKLSKELNIKLGKVTNIIESQIANPYMPYAEYKTLDRASAPAVANPQLEPGTQTVTSTVSLYFEKR